MFRILRDTHLFAGLFSFLFVLMYGSSSVVMSYRPWFRMEPDVSQKQIPLSAGALQGPRVAARELMDLHAMRGDLNDIREDASGFSFRINSPGASHQVAVARASGAADVRTTTPNFAGKLTRLHHMGGLWHEAGVANFGGWLVAIVSLALIVMGATGIYLWFKLHQERKAGGVLLAAGSVWSLIAIIAMRLAG